jgi:hypothetical protein
MLALEALSVGTPVLVNARATPVVQHCRRSQAGLFYADRWEFAEALKLLTHDTQLRGALGRNGRAYVSRHYRWPTVLSKYERLCEQLRGSARDGRTEPPEPDPTRLIVRPREPEADRRDRGRGRFRERDRGRHDRSRHRRRERR